MGFRLVKERGRIFSSLALAVACTGGLTGCGEIAFKRGSGPDAFAADRTRCQGQNADPASVDACLAQAGWHVTDMDAGAAPASAPPQPALLPPPAARPAPAVQEAGAPDASPTPAPPPAPPAPAKTLVVGGWWKFGGGAADLHEAADACVAKLGPANAPDAGLHTVTPALYACLRRNGWHGAAR